MNLERIVGIFVIGLALAQMSLAEFATAGDVPDLHKVFVFGLANPTSDALNHTHKTLAGF